MGLAPFLRQSHAKLHSPIPVPQLRCPSDIQVLRPEASSSSPDLLLLDIFNILIWPVCVCYMPDLPLAITTILFFVPIRESLKHTEYYQPSLDPATLSPSLVTFSRATGTSESHLVPGMAKSAGLRPI